MKTIKLHVIAVFALAAAFSGCSKNESVTPASDVNYLLGFRTSTDPTADYFLSAANLNSTAISATGNGVEMEGWCYYGKAGSTYLTIDYTNNVCIGYSLVDGALKEKGRVAFERMDCIGEDADSNLVSIGAPWGGGSYNCSIQVISKDVAITKSVTTPIYVSYSDTTRLNAWPTGLYVEGSKLYVAFYPLVGTTWETPNTDTAYVSVYSYPGLEYQSTFKDTRTGPIGYYASQPVIVKDEAGNHYTISTSSNTAGFTKFTKPSGILKINAGESKFDDDYFFNVEELGYRVLGGVYTGNGKVVARVVSVATDTTASSWAAFSVSSSPICNMAVLDLNAKTITVVDDVPLHGGQYRTSFLVEDGKVWASITTSATDAYVYRIDPATATAEKGSRIEGSEVQTFFKVKD